MERRGGWWRVQDGTAVLEQPGSAAPLHLLNTRELFVIAVVVSSARVAREVAVQENLEIVGLVLLVLLVLCFVLFFIIYL